MLQRLSFLGVTLGLLCAGCVSSVEVRHDYDTAYDFASATTYAWAMEPAEGDITIRTDLLRDRVRRHADAALAAKGFSHVTDGETPQILVRWYVGVEKKLDLRKLDYTQSTHLPSQNADVFEQGTLIIDLLDLAEKRLVWRGVAQARLKTGVTPDESDALVKEATDKIFAGYPPAK